MTGDAARYGAVKRDIPDRLGAGNFADLDAFLAGAVIEHDMRPLGPAYIGEIAGEIHVTAGIAAKYLAQ